MDMKKNLAKLGVHKLIKRRVSAIGVPPGSPQETIRQEGPARARIRVMDYDAASYVEKEVSDIEETLPYKDQPTVTWINIDGLRQQDIFEKIEARFGIHPVVLDDIVHTMQRPKLEDFGDYLFIIVDMIYQHPQREEIVSEQVSLLVGSNYVISFQEEEWGDVFDPIRDRIRTGRGRVRKMGADYLAYCLLDCIVDHYFVLLEKLSQRVTRLEEALMGDPSPDTPHHIHGMKRELMVLRKQIWPLREVISGLRRAETRLIKKTTGIFLGDVYDHTIQVIDTVESFHDMVSSMHDIYLSMLSQRMNEVMKVLTIIATLFIPLTFIVGVYGMNFDVMPELRWKWGYPAVWGIMIVMITWMLAYFKRKNWL